ncbi:MAG: redox-regulated ATPase YchF, partial [Reyranella sp.]|nr:redox-regulated ATPase YchF [Reyranella sp.]
FSKQKPASESMLSSGASELLKRDGAALRDGKAAREAAIPADERPVFARLQLITAKPMMYVLNVEEGSAATGNAHSARAQAWASSRGMPSVVISAAIEAEVAQLPVEDQAEYLDSLGLKETGLARVVRAGYALLDLVTFFTVGPKEARAWTVRREARAPEAAGVIHTDFEKGFIRAETIAYDDYVALNGEAGARDAGKLRLEGKDYPVKDGDVFHFRFNV